MCQRHGADAPYAATPTKNTAEHSVAPSPNVSARSSPTWTCILQHRSLPGRHTHWRKMPNGPVEQRRELCLRRVAVSSILKMDGVTEMGDQR
jgi:hypothetical protein